MTTREPDRFEAKAAEVLKAVMDAERRGDNMDPIIAAALRHESEDALERAAQVVEQRCYNHGPRPVSWCEYCLMATRIRALAPSPEAPPAKACGYVAFDFGPCVLPVGHNGTHSGASEWAKRQGYAPSEPVAAQQAQAVLVTCSTDTDEHHGAHRLRIPTRSEKSWCLDPIPYSPPSEPIAPADAAAEKRIAELESALRWALGEEDHFPPRELEQGQYWWRIELRRRAKLAALASPAAQGKETHKP